MPVKVQAPVLQIHGLEDQFLLPDALNNTWEWLEKDWTLLTVRQAGHFVQHDAADLVTPRASAIPPATATGSGATASTIRGANTIVATSPST